MLPPIFFFFSWWIHSFCHSMRTIRRSDAADDCSNCRACRFADRRAEGGTSYSSTGCSQTSAHWVRARFARDRVGIFPRFFPHSVDYPLQYRLTPIRESARQRT
jgi:hypothetical protein